MGTLKKFRAAYAFEAAQLAIAGTGNSQITTIPFRLIDGTEMNSIPYFSSSGCSNFNNTSMNNFNLRNLEPRATADIKGNYSVDDYTAISVCSVSYSTQRNLHSDDCSLVYSINITNNDSNDQTVNCIKFVKKFMSSSRSSDCTIYYGNALCYGYYLDSALTIPAGESRTISIELKITVGE